MPNNITESKLKVILQNTKEDQPKSNLGRGLIFTGLFHILYFHNRPYFRR